MSKKLPLIILSIAIILGLVAYRYGLSNQNEMPPISLENEDVGFHNWHLFTPPDNQFHVMLPALPQHATESIADPKNEQGSRLYDMYVSEKENGSVFMISMITMENAKIDQNTLKNVLNEMVAANPENKLRNMQMGVYKEYPAMDFSVENKQAIFDGKAFLIGNKLYVLTLAAKPNNYNRKEFEFFINSFELEP